MNNGKIPSVIRWNRSDYAKLSYAVRKFNKTVSQLEGMNQNVLPPEFNYKELRDSIYSRRELNRTIKSLRRFSKESQQRIVTTSKGEQLTQWQYSELKKAQKRAIDVITDKAREIVESDTNVMGDSEFKKLLRTKESIQDLFNRKGYEFRRTVGRTMSWGRNDYDLWRADIYRQNYMNALEKMSTYDNYELLKAKLEKIENPIKFYEYIQKSQTLQDLFLYYNDSPTAQTYGGFSSNQEAFDKAIFDDLEIKKPKTKKK